MVHCVDFWRKWKREPNFCGLGKKSSRSYDAYIEFVEDFSKRYSIPQEIVYLNVPHASVCDLLRFKEDSDIRKRAQEEIANVLRERKSVTRAYVRARLGIISEPRAAVVPPIVAAASGISKEVYDTTRVKDRIRLLNNAISTAERVVLIEIMKREGLDNEYEALGKALIWAKERIENES